ncbi:MAG: arylesterase [Gemmatimonadota bacterium]|nr:arylesterase [Gemmatimonadota bacterium]
MIPKYVPVFALVAALLACSQPSREPRERSIPPTATGDRPSVVFLGTSLTAGLGLEPEQAYPALVQQKIDSAGLGFRVVNAGVSGETSAGARRRVDWLLREPVAVLVLETGANDGLRGLPPDSLRANIQAVFDRARAISPSPRLVLVGMRVPPNYGRTYTERFQAIYPELARENGAALVPFLLDRVGGVAQLNQADGIHPTAEGQRVMAETVWRVLEPVLRGKA